MDKAQAGGSNCVLIVEDDPVTRQGVRAVLEEEGCAVAEVPDGRAALDYLFEGARPRLILLDLNMPIMTGWDFRAEQLADPDLRQIPVVVMTGNTDYGCEMTTLRPDGHLQKPVDVDELRGVLGRFR